MNEDLDSDLATLDEEEIRRCGEESIFDCNDDDIYLVDLVVYLVPNVDTEFSSPFPRNLLCKVFVMGHAKGFKFMLESSWSAPLLRFMNSMNTEIMGSFSTANSSSLL